MVADVICPASAKEIRASKARDGGHRQHYLMKIMDHHFGPK